MGKKPATEICALCMRKRRLCKSHYLGKALHRMMNRESPGGQVVLTPKIITQNPRQLVAHLLCRECEERIAKLGEVPALSLINRGETFPLLDRMRLAPPMETYVGLAAYSGTDMGIDLQAISYYALSLAWRGSVKKWPTMKGQTTTAALGAHEEPIRRFLAGDSGFPDNVSIVLTVCTDEASKRIVNAPGAFQRRRTSISRSKCSSVAFGSSSSPATRSRPP